MGRPNWVTPLSKPCLCTEIPRSLPVWLQGVSYSQCPCPAPCPPRYSPLLPRPSCPQLPPEYGCLLSQPPPSTKKPPTPTKNKVPLTAKCMAMAGTKRIPEQHQASQSRREAGAAGAGPLPAFPCLLYCSAHEIML